MKKLTLAVLILLLGGCTKQEKDKREWDAMCSAHGGWYNNTYDWREIKGVNGWDKYIVGIQCRDGTWIYGEAPDA